MADVEFLEAATILYWLAGKETETMPLDSRFETCDAAHVLKDVTRALRSEETQSLWDRMREEMDSGGVDAATGFLEAEFARIKTDFDREMERLASRSRT